MRAPATTPMTVAANRAIHTGTVTMGTMKRILVRLVFSTMKTTRMATRAAAATSRLVTAGRRDSLGFSATTPAWHPSPARPWPQPRVVAGGERFPAQSAAWIVMVCEPEPRLPRSTDWGVPAAPGPGDVPDQG